MRTVPTPREQLASILRQSRLDAGFESHGTLAKRLNVSRPVISKAENPAQPVPEYEDKAASLRVWSPGIIHGLAQTEGYARSLIDVEPATTDEIARVRLANRMARQRRVLYREECAVGVVRGRRDGV